MRVEPVGNCVLGSLHRIRTPCGRALFEFGRLPSAHDASEDYQRMLDGLRHHVLDESPRQLL